MSEKNELIRLDAQLLDMIPPAAFTASLQNGHRFVAYRRLKDREDNQELVTGMTVTVELSPYDMSKGRIVEEDRRQDL